MQCKLRRQFQELTEIVDLCTKKQIWSERVTCAQREAPGLAPSVLSTINVHLLVKSCD